MTDQSSSIQPCPSCGHLPGQKVGPPALARCINPECGGSKLGAKTLADWNTRASLQATTEYIAKGYAEVINRNNLKPTHDPYTNPNATIYYECGCGAILDPQTKSFAALNNYASEKGWKIRFGADGYTPYCVKCGEDVE